MHVMLDLETMGNGANSAIIAIGAVAFNEGGIRDRYYRQVSLSSSVSIGLDCDPSTVVWWMQQSESARSAFTDNDSAMHIRGALSELAKWFIDVGGVEVWGNGAAFDNVILSNAYRKTGAEQPWKFWNDRCYRTVKAMNAGIPVKRIGTYHNAVDDAETQAVHLCAIFGWID